MRILIVAPSWIGDTILAQPLFMRLHEKHRDLALDVLAPPWTAPLLARMPEVRKVLGNPFAHGEFNLAARWRLGRELRSERYDEAIILPNSWKSALSPFFAGIPLRTGYSGEARVGLLNRRHILDRNGLPQLAQRYAQLAEAPGAAPNAQALPQIHLSSSRAQQDAVRAALGLPLDAAPAIFCPGAEFGPAKRWPSRHFAALARLLAVDGIPVWLLGSNKDTTLGDGIAQMSQGHALNLCGRTTLEQAIDLIAGARLVVSNDSGLMHVAAALARPLYALYGSSSPIYTPPLSAHARIISLHVDCSPCFKRACPLGHFKCMEELKAELVLNEIHRTDTDRG
ncbi:ADP-heptose--LPS heptosyltransferase 2 [Sterolibacterium denitrificans]|uniref:ADP-heptose--LPS heptosyltransferase 2 n=2 Tax=Sterolibacterium denitrificans TaxID=157592 RepID=A0A7Z7HS83_9PROT|nr:lipopolysaccharide heptosyltransferase II [Sterolibacterium denitrificans]KYC29157.1 ADP-heptose--LPS heptosyltransferase [Sterolibacterium denitrificans]SMB29326.1 ADP-heptose--LPS heptosyltransferase 2 [Sterolibacterium denitrificans]